MIERTTQVQLTCHRCRELLSGYADAELTRHEVQAVSRHLANCTRCATESTHMILLKKLLQHWEGIEGSPEFFEDVLEKVIGESQTMSSSRYPSRSHGH